MVRNGGVRRGHSIRYRRTNEGATSLGEDGGCTAARRRSFGHSHHHLESIRASSLTLECLGDRTEFVAASDGEHIEARQKSHRHPQTCHDH